jgi:hypothetical protein
MPSANDELPVQRALARSIWREHIVCFAAVVAFLYLQLG